MMLLIMREDLEQGWERAYIDKQIELCLAIGGATGKLAAVLIQNRDSNNVVHASQVILAKLAGIAPKTVNKSLKDLVGADLVRRLDNGTYVVNPRWVNYGTKTSLEKNMAIYENGYSALLSKVYARTD